MTKPQSIAPWLASILTLLYLGLLAALVLWPGASLIERLRWLDSGICAQLPSHSFYPGGERLPLCARNTGIYLGFMLTLLTLYATRRGRVQQLPPLKITLVLITGIIILAIDGLNSLFLDLGLPHLYQPHNIIRLITGLITGLALGLLIFPIFNSLLWCAYDEERSVPTGKSLLFFLPALILSFFAIVSQNSLILYPVALLSTAGILTALSSVNMIVILVISKREQSFRYYRELFPFFSLALVCAIVEMLVLAQLKLSLLQAMGL
jgi:uncharacterized membrane protein